MGQAAVSAGIVSPILIIVVAITGISSFAIPDFSFGFHLRYYRFLFILLGFMAGFVGVSLRSIYIHFNSL
ncbi:MAG: spore germination protein [Clostridia bacterium]|nr:spore germination protein [Clostridia bacterium]